MKILLLLFVTSLSFAQSIEYENIFEIDNTPKVELYDRMNDALHEMYGGKAEYDENIIQADRERGIIKFSYLMVYKPEKMSRSDDGVVNYDVNMFFKENKCKVIFKNFEHIGKAMSFYIITEDEEYPYSKKNYLKFRKRAWKELKTIVNTDVEVEFEKIRTILMSNENDW